MDGHYIEIYGPVEKDGKIKKILEEGVREGVYPGAALLVARKGDIVFSGEVGNVSRGSDSVPIKKGTIFDLASLTKPLSTSLAMMRLVDTGKIEIDQPLKEIIKTTPLKDKEGLTLRLLLSHSAGLKDWKPFYLELVKYKIKERKRILRDRIIEGPLVYDPGKGCLYSDLGFMILEWVIEEVTGMDLYRFVEGSFYKPLMLKRTFLSTNASFIHFNESEFAATEDCPWRKRVIQGEVHDENAYALGGYSGHAGLFGTVEEVFSIADLLMKHFKGERDDFFKPETIKEFFKRQDTVPGCSHTLGWDTPSRTGSSSGKYFSKNSIGHLGFTGTSMWLDLERDVIVIFLTNRIHPTRNNKRIRSFRPRIHDLIMEELDVSIE